MSEKTIYTIKDLPKDKTDLKRAKGLTERQINKMAKEDINAILLTPEELAQFKRVHPPIEVDVKQIRHKLHISQSVFAAFFGVSKRTLQDWEQGRRHPKGPARTLLVLISKKPRLVQEILTG